VAPCIVSEWDSGHAAADLHQHLEMALVSLIRLLFRQLPSSSSSAHLPPSSSSSAPALALALALVPRCWFCGYFSSCPGPPALALAQVQLQLQTRRRCRCRASSHLYAASSKASRQLSKSTAERLLAAAS